jgi:hypothetical protein
MALSCSPADQERRELKLKELEDRLYSGVSSVSDRSRSVNYQSPEELRRIIKGLRKDYDFCNGDYAGRGRRVMYSSVYPWI